MKNAVSIQLGQNVEIRKNGVLVQRAKNLVVATGRNWIAERMVLNTPDIMSHLALGSTTGFSSELVTNGDMELDSNWSNYGTPSSNVRSAAQSHSGTYSRSFVAPGTADDGIRSAAFTTVTGTDIFVQAWIRPTITSCYVAVRQGDDDKFLYIKRWTGLTAGAWNKIDLSIVETNGGAGAYIAFFSDAAGTFFIDDVSVVNSVALTETTLIAEMNRLPFISSVRTGNYIEYICDWVAGVGTGTISEAGIFNNAVGGTMLSRIAFPPINKLADDSLSINWKVYVTSV
jgi:hypothetical protein